MRTIDTGSQVCAIQFNEHHRELLSSHGFSDNQLILWKFPSMIKIKEFTGHTMRVLHMSKSPDGQCVCTASPDESLRFWDIFNCGDAAGVRDNTRANVFGATPMKEHCFRQQMSGTPTIR
jgi:cell division cycle protein 20 (cofactor of APC complex)